MVLINVEGTNAESLHTGLLVLINRFLSNVFVREK